jgi:type VI secretion system secreted protein Hcp
MPLDAFMKLEEPKLDGESADDGHPKEIEILSFEQTILRTRGGAPGSPDAKKATSQHSAMTVIKPLDKSSPKLYQAASAGTLFKKVTIAVCQPGGTTKTDKSGWKKIVYLEIILEGVHISRVRLVGDPRLHYFAASGLGMGPLEEVDLSYNKIQWMYKGGTEKLKISGKWNLLTNSAT